MKSNVHSCGGLLIVCVLIAFFFSFPRTGVAQSINGHVYASDQTPLPGVNIVIASLGRGVVSKVDGSFVIENVPPNTYTISFSYVGFKTEQREVTLDEGEVILNVRLSPEVIEGEEVLVEVERSDVLTRDSRSVSVMEPEDLESLRGQTLGETLDQLPGVTTLQTGPSISKPVVRGLHSQRVLVLNAGISQEGQQWGGEHAPEIDPFAPVRIEVIKGVAGVEYGVGAIGGVISLEPLDLPYLPSQGIQGQASANGFSNNLQGAAALYLEGALNRVPGLGWRIQGSFRKAGDSHTPDYVVRNSAFREANGSASVGLRRERFNLVALYSHFGTELGIFSGAHIGNRNDLLRVIERGQPINTGDFGYDIRPPKQQISHDLVSLHADINLPSGHLIEGQYGFQINHRQEFDAHGRGDNAPDESVEPAFDLSLISHSIELKFQHAPSTHFFGTVGINGLNQLNLNGATGFLIPNFRALTGGIFARETWIRDRWTFEAGARFDYRWIRAWPRENGSRGAPVKRISDYASFSGVVGTIWKFAPTWSVAVNLGTGWRPPSVNELYNFGVHHGTAQFEIGNPELDTERSLGLDMTLRHSSSVSRFEFSVYNNLFERFIYLFPDPEPRVTIRGTFPTFRYEQSDARLRGFEFVYEYDVTRYLMLGMQASLVRGDNLDTDEPLINMPSDRLIPRAVIRLGDTELVRNTQVSFESVMVRKQTRFPANADYADPPDGYVLFNAGLSAEVQLQRTPLSINVDVQNVFNTAYRDYLSRFRYFIDDPGRSVILRIQVPIGVDR